MSRLLLAGSNSVHTFNYLKLIDGFFDDVLLITTSPVNNYSGTYFHFNFSLKNPVRAYKTIQSLNKVMRSYSPDVIHIQQANSIAYLTLHAAKKIHVPKILTAWGSDILTTPSEGPLYRQMVKWNLHHSDYFTSDAVTVADRMKELHSDKNIDVTVVNFGIDVKFPSVEKENIIYTNRLHKKLYRIDKIIRAFRKVADSFTDWRLIIAAEGEETNYLKQLVSDEDLNNRVEFVGWVSKEENFKLYAKAKIFVSVPDSDATSISLLEAMAAGCVPVVSDLPSNHEWIEDGRNGFIVKNLEQNFILDAINSDIDKISSLNKSIIQQRATKEVAREKFINLYKKALNITK